MSFTRLLREKRFWLIMVFKFCLIALSLLLAFLVRFDLTLSLANWQLFTQLLAPLLIIKLTVFWKMGLNHGWWRYVSISDVIEIFKANVFASALFVLYVTFSHGMAGIPRSVLLLDGTICFLLGCGVRLATRAYRENYFPMPLAQEENLRKVLLVGAGSAGQLIVREMRQNPTLAISVVGYIDDDPEKQDRHFNGVPVLGKQEDIDRICEEHDVAEIIIAIPSATGKQVRTIVDRCRKTGVTFKILPGVGDLIDGNVTVQQIKEVDLEDLLGREPVKLDIGKIKSYLEGKRILVTGAAGSIGSEICRQVARFNPDKLILLDVAETPLFFLERELTERFPGLHLTAVIGDIRARTLLGATFDEFLPEVVFHAAAYKHVPMMEANPEAAANNNVRGTKIIADAAHQFGVKNFVMISTDKAVNPTNIMGASKRAAEIYVQNLARRSKTNYVTVRFGNVLGSNGSVIPIFREQIKKGGPVTVTHPEVIRYFMTIPEAAQLVLQAGSMGKGGEIFLLDMGEPVRIVTLAEEMIRLSGFRPYEDIDISFTGLRPGEKLYEELLLAGEGVQPTCHAKIMVAKATHYDWHVLNHQIEDLYLATQQADTDRVVGIIEKIVPEYRCQKNRKETRYKQEPLEQTLASLPSKQVDALHTGFSVVP
jgi:FlaA1/EpsC-like NDP-sugar epimerase